MDLDLSSLKERDAALRKIDVAVNSADAALPPVRGTSATPAPPKPVPAVAAKLPPTDSPSAADSKPRHRKNAYEYFNEWDSFDVDKELTKLEPNPAIVELSEEEADDGLPPGLTAADLQGLSAIEVLATPEPSARTNTRTLCAQRACVPSWRVSAQCRRHTTHAPPRCKSSARPAPCACPPAASQRERRAMNEKAKGNEHYKAGDHRPAIQAYTHALRLQQNNAVVYANRGMCYLKLKQYRQALADCTAAVQIDDAYTKAYLRRGIAHRRLGQHSQALADLDVVLGREPRNQEASEHRRCSQLEVEKAERELAAAGGGAAVAPKKSQLVIEEVDGDSDDDAGGDGAAQQGELKRLYREEAEKDRHERERASRNESHGKQRPGRFVDPQALQESEELLGSLAMMGTGMAAQALPQTEPIRQKVKPVEDATDMRASSLEFTRASCFDGPRPGQVFKHGPKGLGYYQDQNAVAATRSGHSPGNAPGSQPSTTRRLQIEEDEDEDEDEAGGSAQVAKAPLRRLQIEEDEDEDEDEEAVQLTPAMRAAVEVADALREAGNALFKKGQYEEAIPKYTQALDGLQAKGVNDVELLTKCWNNRAACACQLQDYALAQADCTEVLHRVPKDAKALMRRAFAHEALERFGEALQDMRAVVALRPGAREASAACIRLSKIVAQLEKEGRQAPPPRTSAAAPQSSAAKPADHDQTAAAAAAAAAAADEVKVRGTAAFRAGDYKKAAELYYEASRTAPECHTHFSNLALALLKLGQPQHAVTAAQRCTELTPTFAKGHYRLGQALHARGDTAAACAAFRAGLAHAAGTEMVEMRRELDACEKTLAAAAAASQPPEPAVVAPAAGSPAKASSNEADSPAAQQRGRVDVSKAADIARRVAERAQSAQSPASAQALQSFSGFERTFLALWAKGKCSDAPRLREQLELLPTTQQGLVAFVGDTLSAELLSALVLAAERVLSPAAPADAAGLLCRLSCARRFDMLWMFVDKAEQKAAGEIVRRVVAAGGGPTEDDLAAVCKRCGIKKLGGA